MRLGDLMKRLSKQQLFARFLRVVVLRELNAQQWVGWADLTPDQRQWWMRLAEMGLEQARNEVTVK